MLEESLRYPLESDDSIATLLIGGLLTALSVFIIPAFILQGYLVRVLRSSVAGESEAPSFTDWGDLFVDGIKLLLINIVFGIVVSIPFLIVVTVFVGGVAIGDPRSGGAALTLVGILLLAVVGLLTLVLAYFLPAMFANFAVEDRLGAAFDVSTVKSVALTSEYFVAVLLGVVLGAVINSVAGPLSLVLIGLPLLFYGQVVTYYLFGRAYAEGRTASGLSPATRSAATTTDRSGGV